MAFVRKKKVGEHEYYQLVENYREDGRHRQRVVVHLGHHDSVEGALEALREKHDELLASDMEKRIRKAEWEARNYDISLRKYWDEGFTRYHGGEIPTPKDVAALSGDDTPAPKTDEVVSTSSFMGMTHTSYRPQRVDRTPEQHEYRKTFSFGEEYEFRPEYSPNYYGRMTSFEGAWKFDRWLDAYWHWTNKAAKLRAKHERKKTKLQEKITMLESVVTNAKAAPGPPKRW